MKSDENEKIKFNKNIYIAVIGRCGGCFYCANACQENAIKEWTPPTIDYSRCTRCLKCIEACPRDVLKIVY